jgi:excisionase family DNA binding protein
MKTPRKPLPSEDLGRADALLTTTDVARLLRVHPKHVYRLLRRGLPAHRIGGEWRFRSHEVLRWAGARRPPRSAEPEAGRSPDRHRSSPPPLVAANGDVAVEQLLSRLGSPGGAVVGFVQSDRAGGIELLRQGDVIAAGCHGGEIPKTLEDERLAFIHLVEREVGLAFRPGLNLRTLRSLGPYRLASRPATAGVRVHFDEQLRRHGVDPDAVHARALLLTCHRDVVCAVARGEADVGLSSSAWAQRVGLDCLPLYRETYGLLVRANLLGDSRLVALCEVAQGTELRTAMRDVRGYEPASMGTISYVTNRAEAKAVDTV